VRSFFEALKTVPGLRSYTTGITPIALADASGANMIEDVTHDPEFGAMCGLREDDVRELLRGVFGDADSVISRVLAMMKHFYNGYHFLGTGADGLTEPLFNTQMCLFFVRRLHKNPAGFRRNVVEEWSHDFTLAKLSQLLDNNVRVSENVIKVIAAHPTLPIIQAQLASNRPVAAVADRTVRLRELLEYNDVESLHRLATFMFHHGLVTLAGPGMIGTPNRIINDPLVGLLTSIEPMLSAWSINVSDLIDNPTPQKVWNMVSAVTTGLDTKYDRNFTEAGLQALIEYALRQLQDRFDFVVACEQTKKKRRLDVMLVSNKSKNVLILELKRLRPASSRSKSCVTWLDRAVLSKPRSYVQDQLAVTDAKLRFPNEVNVSATEMVTPLTVEELQNAALRQAEDYGRLLRAAGTTELISVCGVIHWTQLLAADACGKSLIVVSSINEISN
jgi:hypothetical protein